VVENEREGMTPFLSICIPTYNRSAMLRQAVESIGIKSSQVEIIVSDDGSTDETWHNINEWADLYPNMWLYRNETNLGLTKNWNKVLSYATGDWLCLLADDDYFKEGAGVRALAMLHTVPDPSLIVYSRSTTSSVHPAGIKTVTGLQLPSASGNFWHRSIYDDLGGFDDRLKYSPDCEYWYRIAAHYPVGKIGEKYTKYREHENNYMWHTWRQPDLMEQMELLAKINMAHRGEDVNNKIMVRETVDNALWGTAVYILMKAKKAGKDDIYKMYIPIVKILANTPIRAKIAEVWS
jgi:glycosyltransferase involved in cell wall biosynthesis